MKIIRMRIKDAQSLILLQANLGIKMQWRPELMPREYNFPAALHIDDDDDCIESGYIR